MIRQRLVTLFGRARLAAREARPSQLPVRDDITLPAEVPDVATAAPPTIDASSPTGKKARVIVVEDSPTVAAVVRYFLELEGFEVHVAVDGADGLACATQRPFDVVVSDINMPGMDGIAMVQALRQDPKTAHIAVIMLTEERGVDREAEAFAAGADAYLLKPVEPRRLTAQVRAVLSRGGGGTAAAKSA